MKKLYLVFPVFIILALAGCRGGKKTETYTVNGDISSANACAGALPATVKVSIIIYDKNESVGLPGTVMTDNTGKFTITHTRDINLAKEADHWEFDKITRDDGTDICDHPDMKCEVGKCANFATNAKNKYKMNEKGSYRVSCKCS